MAISAVVSPLKRALQNVINRTLFTPVYTVKDNPSIVSLPHFKNELVYNHSDWREWNLTGRNSVSNECLVFTPDNVNGTMATIATNLKSSTKYGVLANVVLKGSDYFEFDFDNAIGAGGFYKNLSLGNNKIIGTTSSSITSNQLMVYQGIFPVDQICKARDIMLFELPPNSEIEDDFTNLSADALYAKYAVVTVPGDLKCVVLGRTLKNEADYIYATYGGWSSSAGVIADSTGLEYTADGTNWRTSILNGVYKNSTKYGMLYNVVSQNITYDLALGGGGEELLPNNTVIPKDVGNQKIVFTTTINIVLNRLFIMLNSPTEPAGNKIKIRDIRIFELTDSEIESDFTNMTADQLAVKYPMCVGTDGKTGGVKSVGDIQATNLITNGNFRTDSNSDGIADGWSSTFATNSLSNNIQHCTANAQSQNIMNVTYKEDHVVGHIYYYSVWVKADSSLVRLNNGVNVYNHSGSGQFERLSYIETSTNVANPHSGLYDYRASDWTEIQIKNAIAIDLTATFGVGLEPDQATCDRIFADYFNGSKSITQLRSVGKNLIDRSKMVLGDLSSADGSDVASSTWLRHNPYIRCKPNTSYTKTSPSSSFVIFYDIDKNCLGVYSNDTPVVSPNNAGFMRWSFAGTDLNANYQVEEGLTATAYEPYRETTCLIPTDLKSVSDVRDKFDVSTGVLTKRNEQHFLVAENITGLYTSGVNIDVVFFTKPSDYLGYGNVTQYGIQTILLDGYRTGIWADDVANIGIIYDSSDYAMGIIVAKGAYASLEQAQSALVGKKLLYQLANPVVKKYEKVLLGSDLKMEKGGTLYVEKVDGSVVGVVPNLEIQYERSA